MEQEKNEIFLNEIENAKNYIIHSLRGEELKPFAINFLSDFTKAKISQLIGDDIDKIFLLTADDLRHIFNRHGELGKKVKRRKKEFLMKPTDILRIPDILAQPDSIELTPFDIKNGQGIRFSKKFDDGRIFCVFVEMWLDGLNYHIKTGYKNALQGLIDLFVISDLLIIDNENLSGTNNTQKVPDWSNDTPQAARDRGFRLVNGCPYFRNILNDYYLLNETNISFGDKIVKGRYAVVDLYHIQPSHINGQRNPRYFLDEAQPKNRIDQASVLAYKNIAKNLRPEEIIDGNTAFIGAPIVNYKGEVIQGNNRIMALRELFDNNAEYHNQLADYSDAVYLKIMKTIDLDDPKNYSFEIDSDWGWHEWEININGQITISHPIIVRLVDVIDFTAIMLGQKTAQDTESGGEQALDTNRIRTQLSDEQFTSFANILLNSYDDDESLKETITCNASEALKFLYKLKTINDTQFQTALKENGLPTDKTIDSLMELLNENIFNNADTDLRQRFNALPNLAKRGLLKVMHRDVQSPKDKGNVK